MNTKSAKELLAQADRLMRQNRAPEELPVLTDLVLEPVVENPVPNLDDRVYDDPIDYDLLPPAPDKPPGPVGFDDTRSRGERRYVDLSAPITGIPKDHRFASTPMPTAVARPPVIEVESPSPPAPGPVIVAARPEPIPTPPPPPPPPAIAPTPAPVMPPQAAAPAVDAEAALKAALAKELDDLKNSIFSEAMQQLELHANGSLKRELRVALHHELERGIEKVATQCAEVVMHRVRNVVSDAVDAEIARLRERLSKQ